MAKLEIKAQFLLHLSASEIRVLREALSGRLGPDDTDAARRLAADVSRQQTAATVQCLRQLAVAAEGLNAAISIPKQAVTPPKPPQPGPESEWSVIEIVPEEPE